MERILVRTVRSTINSSNSSNRSQAHQERHRTRWDGKAGSLALFPPAYPGTHTHTYKQKTQLHACNSELSCVVKDMEFDV